jgi:hypothetical protein
MCSQQPRRSLTKNFSFWETTPPPILTLFLVALTCSIYCVCVARIFVQSQLGYRLLHMHQHIIDCPEVKTYLYCLKKSKGARLWTDTKVTCVLLFLGHRTRLFPCDVAMRWKHKWMWRGPPPLFLSLFFTCLESFELWTYNVIHWDANKFMGQ